MDNVLIWGTGTEFYENHNLIKSVEEKGDFQIVGYVSKDTCSSCFLDRPVYSSDKISQLSWDYIIVATGKKYFIEIVQFATIILNISREKLIWGGGIEDSWFSLG